MKELFGEIKTLKASEKHELERLLSKRVSAKAIIEPELARRAALLSRKLGVQLGLLIGRDGRIEYLAVGSKERLYLPDLGRFRLDRARLRRLRLVVFLPDGENYLEHVGQFGIRSRAAGPDVPSDLLADLEKLRLDALLVFAVLADGTPGPLTFAHLDPEASRRPKGYSAEIHHSTGAVRSAERPLIYQHARDIFDFKLDFEQFIDDLESSVNAATDRGYETTGDKAILVGAYAGSGREAFAAMEELIELAKTAGLQVLDSVIQRRKSLDPKTLIGKGKVEELVLHALDLGADLLVFDRELSPGQLRSITNITELRVVDRSMLILDIFAQRAKSSEGRLQVELAQLKYSLPRLTETDTGLSRLTGGIGGRGPGETKLEIGRRRVRDRIALLEKKIDKVAEQRGVRRERRQIRGVPVIAIVGYTNAGKSTLLNALTKGEVFVESKLFATLDPASRRMRFPNDKEVIFVDTVGFIRQLPKELVAAFRATLEEVGEADLLIHLVDASNPDLRKQIEVVTNTLEQLGFGDKRRILVLNKVDLLSPLEEKALLNSLEALPVSAVTRTGFEELLSRLQTELAETFAGQDPGRFLESYPW